MYVYIYQEKLHSIVRKVMESQTNLNKILSMVS
jgi:hypothetical protein